MPAEIDGHAVEIRYGEISTPAIATIEGWVFEIHDETIDLRKIAMGNKAK